MMKSKATSILLSLMIAFALWLYVVTNVSPEDDYTFHNIPVVMEGESVLNEQNLMVTGISADGVDLTLSGNRSDLAKVNSGNIAMKLDLSKIQEPGKIALTPGIALPPDVASGALTVESRSPASIYVTVEHRRNKEVPVEIRWEGSTPDGFMSDRENRVLDYDAVTVVGPASVADLIEKAVIEVNLNEQRKSISEDFRYTLCNAEGEPVDAELITTNVETVHLDVKIQQVKEVKLTVDVTYGGGATHENTKITVEPQKILLSGGEAVLEELGSSITLGRIDLKNIEKSQTLTYPITLPEGVTNLSNISEAAVEIKFTGLSLKEYEVENILAENIPEGLEAEIMEKKITVVLRGPAAVLSQIQAEDITIRADFTDAVAGTSTFKATVHFPEEYAAAGPVKSYSVTANIW